MHDANKKMKFVINIVFIYAFEDLHAGCEFDTLLQFLQDKYIVDYSTFEYVHPGCQLNIL